MSHRLVTLDALLVFCRSSLVAVLAGVSPFSLLWQGIFAFQEQRFDGPLVTLHLWSLKFRIPPYREHLLLLRGALNCLFCRNGSCWGNAG